MNNDVRNEPLAVSPDSGDGPLRHFRVGRRVVLQSLVAGAGAMVFASRVPAADGHHAATAPEAAAIGADSPLLFLDRHAFDTLALLSEQIVPGARAVKAPEFLDRLLAVESTETQERFIQALGAFEHEAREAHGVSWKALTEIQATALLTKISTLPDSDPTRIAFDGIKSAVAETYFSSEAGMKELGWNGSRAFAPPIACG
jgi:hypothetical protein